MPIIKEIGSIPVKVKSLAFTETAVKKSPQIEIVVEDSKGDYLSGYLSLVGGALEVTVNTLRQAFGFNNDFETLKEQVVGKECIIVTAMESDGNGGERIRIKFINNIRSGGKPIENVGALLKNLTAQAKRIVTKDRPAAAPRKQADDDANEFRR